ncbi:formylglycine-generating enzyme family protein [Anabaena sp. UHCC 0399]|uniref:formylglycine-generating enzyme family protein n=1 Tax=Anabaena sp. UHCC 0399 TaxID=3110238 RepID=UPI002B1F70C7|nr:formylglycine-generating enzyme family protein [Anabaena sp. UHCC 0399]MEA5568448.1 formylglycine-generating enzyme family protein [Anabaena sp. UHCC 0399]
MSQVKPEVVNRRIELFEKRFGKAHLYLAYHAAFPLALTPDLLYSLWANFPRDIHGEFLNIPWIAVADLLLSGLCEEVGYELYEMDLAIRNLLLKQLKEDEKFGQARINELSDFLLDYTRQQFQSDDFDTEFVQSQRWIALAYTRPHEVACEIALAFSKLDLQDTAEMVRLASLTATITEPLAEFQPLLIYARGMAKFARGNLADAKAQFDELVAGGKPIQIVGVRLPIPEEMRTSLFKRLTRREFIELATLGSAGLLMTVVFRSLQEDSRLQSFQFETVTVDARGNIINRSNEQARYFAEDLGNGVSLEMVQIPEGIFTMGSPAGEAQRDSDESPQRQVRIPGFFMGKYAVTQEQYQAIMGINPARFKGDKRPVETVSWNDAVEFCEKLSQKTGKTYRLPSEAEWEYACRAGTITPFYFGETITTDLVNYNGNYPYVSAPKGEYRQQTTNVGIFPPNSFGLYDMCGNIWEWCEDVYNDSYQSAPTDGSAWLTGSDNNIKLLRGGSWSNDAWDCRSAIRLGIGPANRYLNVGFRIVAVVLA